MGKYKEQPKYNVLSIRVSDEEKAVLDELTRRDHTSISNVMREAIRSYISTSGLAVTATTLTSADVYAYHVERVHTAMCTPFGVGGDVPRHI